MERAEKNEEILETQIVTFYPYRISLVSLSFTFRCLLSSRRWRWFLPSEYCDNDFYVLTVSSRQQRQQSYFTLQGDWSVNCDVCGCSGNCVFSLLMSASRNTKAKENIFPFVYETKNRFFTRNITLWGFSRHPLYLCRLAMREVFCFAFYFLRLNDMYALVCLVVYQLEKFAFFWFLGDCVKAVHGFV